jgi:hypothetical protein
MSKENVPYVHNGILLSLKKKKWNSAIFEYMVQPEDIMLSEISQAQKDKHYIILPTSQM